MPIDLTWLLLALAGGAVFAAAYSMGRQGNSLARMEIAAAVNVAKQEVGWEYQRYRIESMRMDWLTMSPTARQEYVRRWGRPKWAGGSSPPDPLGGVEPVRHVRGPIP